MTKYHPIDVRYKGPSTAYRGSARRKAEQQASIFAQTKPRAAKTVPTAIPKVRRNQQRPITKRATPAHRLTQMISRMGMGKFTFGMIILVLLLINNPDLLSDMFSPGGTQMRTMP
ncbi:hypothetical protein AL073_05280 [Loktanella sp. 1ANDIMAR09]|nr:hypothetical protein AL073_05280 [Loktanella sp. 1ANDIMAR09]